MSTVSEVIIANHCGLKVGVVSMITNFATGLTKTSHSHEEVLMIAQESAKKLNKLLKTFAMNLS